MATRLYSTLERGLVALPEPPEPIGFYTCGPTVYQRIHVGNARPYVISLWLKRYLEAKGHEVTLVENVTDVNDKIYQAAPNASAALAATAAGWYVEDTDALGLGRPDYEPKATETIAEMIAMIEELLVRGHAYVAGGDVYFRVASYADYGQLARQGEVEDDEPNPAKEDPRDFALWKGHKPSEDTSWDSPWGRGRPGWHIECSAMAHRHLGESFALHLGGIDLRFPHHENELAQSRALGHGSAAIWLHNGHLTTNGAKMAKSEGNDTTLQGALSRWGREALLVLFLSGHWRRPLEYSEATLEQSRVQAERFKNVFVGASFTPQSASQPLPVELVEALDDDFNTPLALALMHRWAGAGQLGELAVTLELFGLGSLTVAGEVPTGIVALAEERQAARAARDFTAADRLRAEIVAAGYEVRDAGAGFELVPLS
jgi:cysteinyl-tRNA synthetase